MLEGKEKKSFFTALGSTDPEDFSPSSISFVRRMGSIYWELAACIDPIRVDRGDVPRELMMLKEEKGEWLRKTLARISSASAASRLPGKRDATV